jgi:hypothetical protein
MGSIWTFTPVPRSDPGGYVYDEGIHYGKYPNVSFAASSAPRRLDGLNTGVRSGCAWVASRCRDLPHFATLPRGIAQKSNDFES